MNNNVAIIGNPRRNWRQAVFNRDGGICALCGCDMALTMRAMDRARELMRFFCAGRGYKSWRETMAMMGLHKKGGPVLSGWEADHIIPLSEGGPDNLDNLRTLCLTCHRGESAKGAKRRAKCERLIKKKPKLKYQQHQLSRLGKDV